MKPEIKNLPLGLLQPNSGQIEDLPKNPRFIKDAEFELLKNSLRDDPEMLDLRELIVMPHNKRYVIIAGNMRFQAAKELGFETLPCKILPADTTAAKLRAYASKDNVAFGSWDMDILADEWDENELRDWNVPIIDTTPDEAEDLPKHKEISTKLLVECKELNRLEELFDELQKRGFICELK